MESLSHTSFSAQQQLSSFVSMAADDEMAQLILEVRIVRLLHGVDSESVFARLLCGSVLTSTLLLSLNALQELSFSRRSFTGVAAEIANSPSSKSASGLNSITEECDEEEQ
ncbi:hypothetical protein BBJ28_00001526 [Nothophytophthora sp. Chile5]|nr:hypothetical protein BBJ28_00001526 [Nothophytophthora sp. Chile5]